MGNTWIEDHQIILKPRGQRIKLDVIWCCVPTNVVIDDDQIYNIVRSILKECSEHSNKVPESQSGNG